LDPPPVELEVHELAWGAAAAAALRAAANGGRAFDLITGSDVVFIEEHLVPLLDTIEALSGRATLTIIATEVRDERCFARFVELAAERFTVRRVPKKKLPREAAAENVVIHELRLK
jgi:hypothetical protein